MLVVFVQLLKYELQIMKTRNKRMNELLELWEELDAADEWFRRGSTTTQIPHHSTPQTRTQYKLENLDSRIDMQTHAGSSSTRP